MRAAATDSGDGMSGQGRILVVDDIPQNVKLLADLLTIKGYEVVAPATAKKDSRASSPRNRTSCSST